MVLYVDENSSNARLSPTGPLLDTDDDDAEKWRPWFACPSRGWSSSPVMGIRRSTIFSLLFIVNDGLPPWSPATKLSRSIESSGLVWFHGPGVTGQPLDAQGSAVSRVTYSLEVAHTRSSPGVRTECAGSSAAAPATPSSA